MRVFIRCCCGRYHSYWNIRTIVRSKLHILYRLGTLLLVGDICDTIIMFIIDGYILLLLD